MTFCQLIKKLTKAKVLCLPHKHADLDAISSAAIAAKLFNGDIGIIDKPSDFALNFIETFRIRVLSYFDVDDYDYVVYTDGCDLKQFNGITAKQAVVIDHHKGPKFEEIPNTVYYNVVSKSEYPSCTYLYYKLFLENEIEIDKQYASYILAGLVGDKALHNANSVLRNEVNELIDISKLTIQHYLAINTHRPVYDKNVLNDYISLMHSADIFHIDEISILFLDAKKRDYYYFLHDNFLTHFGFDLLICRSFDNEKNYVRFEKCSEKLAAKINMHEFLVMLKSKLWHDEYSEIFRRFETNMDFKDVKDVITTEITKAINK